MLLNDLDRQKLRDGSYKQDPYLSKLDSSEIISELAHRPEPPTLESPYIDVDEIELMLDEICDLIPESKQTEFANIKDKILTNLENQRDYLMDNYKEYEKWMND